MANPKRVRDYNPDERVVIPLDPETALRELMRVDPKQIDNDNGAGAMLPRQTSRPASSSRPTTARIRRLSPLP